MKFSSKLLVTAASNAVLNDAKTQFGKNPNFPKDDESLKAVGALFDKLLPTEAQTNSKGKLLYMFLFKCMYGPEPSILMEDAEDGFTIKPLMQNTWDCLKKNMLVGQAANIAMYKNLTELETAVDEAMGKKKGEGDREDDVYTPEEWKEIKAGAKLIYDQGGWQLWKCAASSNTTVLRAANLLCDNTKNPPATWCVGWPWPSRSLAKNYIPQGDFFVFRRGNVSRYAVSSQKGRLLQIWTTPDAVCYETASSGYGSQRGKSDIPSLRAAAKQLGLPYVDIASSIPPALVPIIKAVRPTEETWQMVPESALVTLDDNSQKNLDKMIYAADPHALIKDINSLSGSAYTVAIAHAILVAASSPKVHKDFGEAYKDFSSNTLQAYIEAMAGHKVTRLPDGLEAMLMEAVREWEKAVEKGES
jgi:hypothetical protein